MDHECKHDKEVATMLSENKMLIKTIYGNGQKGILTVVTELNTKMDTIIPQLDHIVENINQLSDFKTGIMAVQADGDKRNFSNQQIMAIVVSAIVGIATVITAYIIK